jgi:hypothetical protein
MKWAWLSISPGMTVFPFRSIVCVPGPPSLPISTLRPVARTRSPLIAIAWLIVKRSSTVTTLPLRRIRSARSEGAAPKQTPATSAPAQKTARR